MSFDFENQNIRKNMYDLMLSYPLKSGLKRVKNIIVGEEND